MDLDGLHDVLGKIITEKLVLGDKARAERYSQAV